MDFRPLSTQETQTLRSALRGNAGGNTLLMDRKDTSFRGTTDEVPDEEVIEAVRSIPCHYATRSGTR